ncbi:hypothetical protein [Flavobacterium mekongense]|uniref:hypothetical protein n=1 Tax=Flavobacterium mekongense TaxID=3379707 RepID=UPI0039995517
MEEINNFFNGNYLFNMISFIFGLIGILLAVIFYFKAIKEKKPNFNIKTFNLIDSKLSTINKLEIKYNNSIVRNLSVSKIAIWNAGADPIKKDDFAPNDHLRIVSRKDIIIYDFEISHQESPNDVKANLISEKQLNLEFDFLNQNDGLIITVYHSGNTSEDILILGTFIGAKKISEPAKKEYLIEMVNKFTEIFTTPYNNLYKVLRVILFPLLILFLMCIMPFAIIAAIFDTVRYQFIKKTPEIFSFEDN